MADLVVVIPTCRRNELLQRTLNSLADCERPDSYRRTIVVENGARAGAREVVAGFANSLNAEYHFCEEGNKSNALNYVLKLAGNDFLVFFDDDVRIQNCVLSDYWLAFQQYGVGRFYGGPTNADYEAQPPDWLIPFFPHSVKGWQWRCDGPIDRPVALGCNWAAAATDLISVGGFDDRLGPGGTSGGGGQEADMQKRLLAAGIQGKYVRGALVWHYVPRSRSTARWTLQRGYRNGISRGVWCDTSGARTALGVPGWVLMEWAGSGWNLLRASLSADSRAMFKAAYEVMVATGVVVGVFRAGYEVRTWRQTEGQKLLSSNASRGAK